MRALAVSVAAWVARRIDVTPDGVKNVAYAVIAMLVIYKRLPQSKAEAWTSVVIAIAALMSTRPRGPGTPGAPDLSPSPETP